MAVNISLEELIDSGAHFGHQARRWNPKMAEYLYGVQEGIHLFDLTKTKAALEAALEALKNAAKDGKVILFVGTKKQAKDKTRKVAEATGCPYVSERWLGGTLTNFEHIKRSIDKLADMKAKLSGGEYAKFTKKERLLIEREITRLERYFGGIATLTKAPDMMVIVDTHKEWGTVREAGSLNVPIVGIVDSNADPTLIDYPIPMNDDANRAVEYVLGLMGTAIMEGKGTKPASAKKLRRGKAKNGKDSN